MGDYLLKGHSLGRRYCVRVAFFRIVEIETDISTTRIQLDDVEADGWGELRVSPHSRLAHNIRSVRVPLQEQWQNGIGRRRFCQATDSLVVGQLNNVGG